MGIIKPDCLLALRRKGPQSMPSRVRRTLSPSPVFVRNTENCGHFRRYSEQRCRVSLHLRLDGGGRGIRTPDTLSGITVFKTACFNRSHIPPRGVSCVAFSIVRPLLPVVPSDHPPDLIQLKVPRASGNVGSFLLSRFRVLMRLAGISAQIPHSQ